MENMENQKEVVSQKESAFDDSSQLDRLETILEDDTETVSQEESVKEVQKEEVQKEEAKEEQEAIPIVDDELIGDYTTLEAIKGKPITELAKSYDEIVREKSRLVNELAKLQKKEEEPQKPIEEETFDDMPDPLDDPKGFATWQKARDEKLLEKAVETLNKKLEDEKQVEADKLAEQDELEAKTKEFQESVLSDLTKSLPKGVAPQEAIDFYIESNKEVLLDGKELKESAKAMFSDKDFLVKMVTDYVNIAVNSKNTKADARKQAYEITKNGLQKRVTGKLKYETAPRTAQEMSYEEELAMELQQIRP